MDDERVRRDDARTSTPAGRGNRTRLVIVILVAFAVVVALYATFARRSGQGQVEATASIALLNARLA